ncbi:MAG: hypothetical protein LBB36_05510 [Fibromonadaceae bacterium]|jgi:hypothetical protein|nr:hypothetical protein [Fibromonadaceae bacterium]
MKHFLFFVAVWAVNAFSAGWYVRTAGYEKCMDTEDGFLVCREDYIVEKNYCYGKERTWSGHSRKKPMYDRNQERVWFDRVLIAVRNLNHRCEYHGWTRLKLADGTWVWKCYLNNREMQDSNCKGFTKR